MNQLVESLREAQAEYCCTRIGFLCTQSANRIEQLEATQRELMEFIEDFIDSWENGMAGDSYVLRNAQKVLDKVRNQK